LTDCDEVQQLPDHDSFLETAAIHSSPPPLPTEQQLAARALFDLDAAMAALPRGSHWTSRQGPAGVRPRPALEANISDDLLREAAGYSLKAKRCSADYLGALRIVLANQADADRRGYVLEINQRNGFAPARVIRTIIEQMQANGISWGHPVWLGPGRTSTVQCLGRDPTEAPEGGRSRDLQKMYRLVEASDDRRREAAEVRGDFPKPLLSLPFICSAEIPY
jgi:hypothetical protein